MRRRATGAAPHRGGRAPPGRRRRLRAPARARFLRAAGPPRRPRAGGRQSRTTSRGRACARRLRRRRGVRPPPRGARSPRGRRTGAGTRRRSRALRRGRPRRQRRPWADRPATRAATRLRHRHCKNECRPAAHMLELGNREEHERGDREGERDEAGRLEQARAAHEPARQQAERDARPEPGHRHVSPVERRLDAHALEQVQQREGRGVDDEDRGEADRSLREHGSLRVQVLDELAQEGRHRVQSARPRPRAGQQPVRRRAGGDREQGGHACEVVGSAVEEHVRRRLDDPAPRPRGVPRARAPQYRGARRSRSPHRAAEADGDQESAPEHTECGQRGKPLPIARGLPRHPWEG